MTPFSSGIGANAGLAGIAAGPDGNIYFTESNRNRIGRINLTTFVITESSAMSGGSDPHGITTGPDGALWFTEFTDGEIGRVATGFTLPVVTNEYPIPGSGNNPYGITAGPDGNLWFTETQLGRRDRPHHHGRQRDRISTDDDRPARRGSPRDRMATSGSPPAGVRARSGGSRRPARSRVHERPDHQRRPAGHRGRRRRQSVLHRERDRGAGSGRSRRRARSASSRRPDRRLRAVGHHERRGRQHLVHRERGESGRAGSTSPPAPSTDPATQIQLRTPRSRAPSRRARRRPPTASTGA